MIIIQALVVNLYKGTNKIIDPPFDVGADFSMDIEIGGDTFTKKPNIMKEIASPLRFGN